MVTLQVLKYKPSDYNDDLSIDRPDDVNRVLTLETFADFRHLRLLDISFVDLAYEMRSPSWSVELHPNFAGSYILHQIIVSCAEDP